MIEILKPKLHNDNLQIMNDAKIKTAYQMARFGTKQQDKPLIYQRPDISHDFLPQITLFTINNLIQFLIQFVILLPYFAIN